MSLTSTSLLDKYAQLLLEYSISARKGMEITINGTYDALPLLRSIVRISSRIGVYPIVFIRDEILEEEFYRNADKDLLKHVPGLDLYLVKNIDATISIVSSTHTKHLSSIDPEKIKIREASRMELRKIFLERSAKGELRWVVAAYPTKAMAQEAGLSYFEFEEFVFKACKLHYDDPVDQWRIQAETQEKIINSISKIKEFRIVGEGTDLVFSTEGRKWINDDGHYNMPGGEIFTGPCEDSINGCIKFSFPVLWHGVEIDGITLCFRDGIVVKASASKGEKALLKLLETDEGARRVGEAAFGLNYDISRYVRNILFDEKIGGTIHIALGSSYPETGGKNISSIHIDMIKDMRSTESKVYGDGDLIYSNGKFLLS